MSGNIFSIAHQASKNWTVVWDQQQQVHERQQWFGETERVHVRLAKGNQCSKEDSRNLSGSKSYYQDNCAAESNFFFFIYFNSIWFFCVCYL